MSFPFVVTPEEAVSDLPTAPPGCCVLVVDDSPTQRRVLSDALHALGYQVELAADGEEALTLARNARPDAVVLDIILPKLNGFEVTRQLRTDPQTKHLKILLLSSKTQQEDQQWGLEQGADGYITKPVDVPRLMTQLSDLLTEGDSPS